MSNSLTFSFGSTRGGLSAGFSRMLTGQNFFISDYTYQGPDKGYVALGTDFPSKIIRLNVEEYGGKIVCQKGALLCASHTIDIQMEFTKTFTSGFFGGEGFVLQGLTGEGDVFLKAGGTVIRRDLEPGEELRISSGCLVGFSNGVDYGELFHKTEWFVLFLFLFPFQLRRKNFVLTISPFVYARCPNGEGIQERICRRRRAFLDNLKGSRCRLAAGATSAAND